MSFPYIGNLEFQLPYKTSNRFEFPITDGLQMQAKYLDKFRMSGRISPMPVEISIMSTMAMRMRLVHEQALMMLDPSILSRIGTLGLSAMDDMMFGGVETANE